MIGDRMMDKMNGHRLIPAFVFTVIVLIGGCGLTPKEPMHYTMDEYALRKVEQSRNSDGTASDKCSVYIQEIEDSRSHKRTFGSSTDFVLFAESVPHWVREGFASLGGSGCTIRFDKKKKSAEASVLTLQVKIYKAYMQHISTSKNANLVLGVVFKKNDEVVDRKVYRGQDTSVNWSTSPHEVESAMNRAMTTIMASLAGDIKRLCAD